MFTGVEWQDCLPPQTADASGTWSFAEHGSTGTLSVNITLDGRHHVAFGGTLPLVTLGQAPGADWAVQLKTAAGTLTIWLTGDVLTYQIPDYTSLDSMFSCALVTYVGTTR